MRCPGQDWSSWTGEVAFETPCPKCDAAVEFFKDETSGRCTKCGNRFQNPRISFDCAQWCSFAEKCLGYAPQQDETSDPGEGALAGRLIRAVKDQFDTQQVRIARSLAVFRHARELLAKEGGDPRIILAASLLLETVADQPAGSPARAAAKPPEIPRQILQDVGLDPDTTDCVCHIIESHRLGKQLETIEFKVVSDSEALAKMAAAAAAGGDPQRLIEIAEERLKTTSGKQHARRVFQPPPEEPAEPGGEACAG